MIKPDPSTPVENKPMTGSALTVSRPTRAQERPMTHEISWYQGRAIDLPGPPITDHSGLAASLASYVEVLFVHKYLLLRCLLLALGLCWGGLLIWPRTYESEAKLMLRVGRESVALDPTLTTSQTLLLQKTQEEEVNSALEILGSRKLLERVVDGIGEEPIMNGWLPNQEKIEHSIFRKNFDRLETQATEGLVYALDSMGIRDEISNRERAVIKLTNSIGIYAPKKSTAITLRAEARTPEMAQTIVQSLTDGFLDEHINVSRTKGSHGFFEQQAADAEKKLEAMLVERSSRLQERKVASVESRHAALTSQLGEIETTLFSAQSSLQKSLAEIEDLSKEAAKTPGEIVATKQTQGDQTWSNMRNTLYELEMEEKRLASQFNSSNTQLIAIREQVTGAKEILNRMESERQDESTTPNPVRMRIEADLQQTRTQVVGLQSMIAETEAQRATKQKEIQELLDFEVEISALDREIASLDSSLLLLKQKKEEARVIDELQKDRISSVGVFQPATFVERAVSPKKSLVAIAFAVLGLMTGLGWVCMRELTSNTLRTPEHVERNLDCSVLAAIPYCRRLKRMHRLVKSNGVSDIRIRCKSILSEILLSRSPNDPSGFRGKSIGVLGIADGCGASSLAVGLAMASSEDAELRTTLIDFDLTNRTVSRAFGLNGAPGFAELVSGEAGRVDCAQHFEQRPLTLISGSAAKSHRRIEADPMAVASVLKELLDDNDVVIVDMPPASRPDQTLMIAQHLDQILVVIESERTDLVEAKRLLRQLQSGNANVVGIVLNKTRNYLPKWLGGLLR